MHTHKYSYQYKYQYKSKYILKYKLEYKFESYIYIYVYTLYESWTMEPSCSAMTRTPHNIKVGYGFFLGLPHLKVNEILMRIDEKCCKLNLPAFSFTSLTGLRVYQARVPDNRFEKCKFIYPLVEDFLIFSLVD